MSNGDISGGGAFPSSIKALKDGQTVIEFARPYSVDLSNWFRDFGQLTSMYDANGHMARVSAVFNSYESDGSGNLTLLDASQRQSIYTNPIFGGKGANNYNRCPGSASQVPSNSAWSSPASAAPWPVSTVTGGASGCNASEVPPGP